MNKQPLYMREVRGQDGELIHSLEQPSPIPFLKPGAQIELTGEVPLHFVVRENYLGAEDEAGNPYRQTVMVRRVASVNVTTNS